MTVVSSAMAEEARRLGLEPPSLTVLPMGADLQTRFVPTRGKVARSTDGLLFVGRLVPKKGLTHLLDALPLVLARRPATTLTIVGFGPEEGALHAQAKRLRIDDRIRFAGPVEQRALPAFFDKAAVFVAPFVRDASGNQEGLPVALMEAIGCECPAVVGDVAGIHDLLGDDARTISVDPREPTSLATAILAMLEDPQAARARARALRAKLLDRVDWQVIADRYGRLLAAIRR
jgi:glycosyltransferase involved in cell wall biosynthesis